MASTRVAACMAHVGPLVPEMSVRPGVHIPGTGYLVDPITAAYSTGCLIRWLDFSDTWVALETGHPSDHIGAILAAAELEGTSRSSRGLANYNLEDVQRAMIIAYEIQGVLGLTNSLSRFGFDHAAYVRIGSAAATTRLLGGRYREICSAVSHAWCDGHPLRIYRQAPNTGPRKSWAGPDASARGLLLAFRAVRGEPHCGSVLTDPKWGMEAVQFKAEPFRLSRRLGSYVMENVLFKAAYPGVVHAQTALEAAIRLHPLVKDKCDAIDRVDVWSYDTAIRITSKTGMLRNAADRDHCLQYLVAVGLLKGNLTEDDFSDMASCDEKLERLRRKIVVHEDPQFTASFLNPEERACPNGVRVKFADGSMTPRINMDQPLGHASRRSEGLPYLERKLLRNLTLRLRSDQVKEVMRVYDDREKYSNMGVSEFMKLFVC